MAQQTPHTQQFQMAPIQLRLDKDHQEPQETEKTQTQLVLQLSLTSPAVAALLTPMEMEWMIMWIYSPMMELNG